MERSFAILLTCVAVAGCGSPVEVRPKVEAPTGGWIMGPQIDGVARNPTGVVVSGQAAPLGRVVLAGADGVVYAAGADEQGDFAVRLPVPDRDLLLRVQAHVGQGVYPTPDRLLVTADPRGPIAVLRIGAPTRRLDRGGVLDAVDTDGYATILSGRAPPESSVDVMAGEAGTAVAAEDGRWIVPVTGNVGPSVRIGSQLFSPPAPGTAVDGVLERRGAGWRIEWSGPDSRSQATWFPDASS